MDTRAISHARPTSRLAEAISGDSFLFQFPRDWGTPELLQIAMKVAESGRRIAIAYASPAASHLAETLAQGACAIGPTDGLGMTTLPAALRRSHGKAVLIYVSCPLDDVRLFQLSLLDENGVILGAQELEELVQSGCIAQTSAPLHLTRPTELPPSSGTCSIVVESPSHAIRCEALRLLAGRMALATQPSSLLAAPAKAIGQCGVDLGVWIDAEGASVQVFDRAGQLVDPEQVLVAIAMRLKLIGSRIVLEKNSTMALIATLRAMGIKVLRSGSTGREMTLAMRKSGAVLGGGPSGRIWFGGPIPMADAIFALNLLAGGASGYLPKPNEPVRALSGLAA